MASVAHSSYVYVPRASGRCSVHRPASTWLRVVRTSPPRENRTVTVDCSDTVRRTMARSPDPATLRLLTVGAVVSGSPPPGGGTPGVGVGVAVGVGVGSPPPPTLTVPVMP